MSDPRTGPPDSGQAQITSGDGNSPQTGYNIRSDALFRVEEIIISYADAASVTTDVTVWDDEDGTGAGNVADKRHVIQNLQPGEVRAVDTDGLRDFEEDVLYQADNNQDGNIEITTVGTLLLALKDVQ